MTALAIASCNIRTDEAGRFSLNDLHRAAGHEPRHKPGNWLQLDQTQELAAELELEVAGIPATQTKKGVGSFVRRELAIAFAAWISPAFHLRVIRGFDSLASARPQEDLQAALNNPHTLRRLLNTQADRVIALEHEAAARAPRVLAFERLTDQRGAMNLTATAKILGIEPRQIFPWLSTMGWIYRARDYGDWLGRQDKIDAGYLIHRLHAIKHTAGVERIHPQVLVTAKGVARLAELLEQASCARTTMPIHSSPY